MRTQLVELDEMVSGLYSLRMLLQRMKKKMTTTRIHKCLKGACESALRCSRCGWLRERARTLMRGRRQTWTDHSCDTWGTSAVASCVHPAMHLAHLIRAAPGEWGIGLAGKAQSRAQPALLEAATASLHTCTS